MSIYHHFSLLPYIKNENKFQFSDNKKGIFNASHSELVLVTIKNRSSNFINKEKAKILEKALNKAINEQSDNYSKMIDKIAHELNHVNYEKLLSLGVAKRYRGTIKIDKAKAKQFSSEVREIASHLSGYSDEDDIEKVVQRLSGQLNKIRGDIFENFLAVALEKIGNTLENTMEEAEELLFQEISNTLEHYGSKTKTKILKKNMLSYKTKSSKVIGNQLKQKIELLLDGNKISISGSQGKSDVAVKGLDGNFTGISAKNYQGGSRHISLLSSANVSGLISDWPGIGEDEKNLALNGLSAISIHASQFQLMKQIFLVQGLMGLSSEEIKSQLFIINRNTAKNPILVFSVYDLLFNPNQNLQGVFTTNMVPITNLPRDSTEFFNFAKTATISIKTQLKISELAKYYK